MPRSGSSACGAVVPLPYSLRPRAVAGFAGSDLRIRCRAAPPVSSHSCETWRRLLVLRKRAEFSLALLEPRRIRSIGPGCQVGFQTFIAHMHLAVAVNGEIYFLRAATSTSQPPPRACTTRH